MSGRHDMNNIISKHRIEQAFRTAAEQNPLADTEDVIQIAADAVGVTPDVVADVIDDDGDGAEEA